MSAEPRPGRRTGRRPGVGDTRGRILDADLRATLVGTQLAGLAMARYVAAVEPVASMDATCLARLIGSTLSRHLTADVGSGPSAGTDVVR